MKTKRLPLVRQKIAAACTLVLLLLIVAVFFNGTTYAPPDIDHAKVLKSLNAETMRRGKEIYTKSCMACHGKDGTASLAQARSFNKDRLRFGNKPFDMWKTITYGAGMMPAQTWIDPAERYYVVQYIRETFIKPSNPRQYFNITEEYLDKLPKSQKTIVQQRAETKEQALKGSLKYGQEWFMHNKSNYGYAIYSQLADHGTSVMTVQLDSTIQLSYNLLRMGVTAAWRGSLNTFDTKYKRYRGEGEPFVEGTVLRGLNMWQWTYGNRFDDLQKTTGVRTPLPAELMTYHGHYTHDKKTILSYSVQGRKMLELPSSAKLKNQVVLTHTLNIAPGGEQTVYVGQLAGADTTVNSHVLANGEETNLETLTSGNIIVNKNGEKFLAIGIHTNAEGVKWKMDDQNRIILVIPQSDKTINVSVIKNAGKSAAELQAFSAYVTKLLATGVADISKMVNGGPALWKKTVKTSGKLNVSRPHHDTRYFEDEDKTASKKLVALPSDYPYAVDNIALPYNNPYNAWIRPTSVGFMNNGKIIITTYMGDVWAAGGIDSTLKNITWQRIATGLYEPMGIKVVDDVIHITDRNGIIILRDLNNDGETDFYERFHSDQDISAFFHAFNFGLERDSKGNFYYVKPGQYTNNRDPGNVIRISADGKKWESIATGFRVNNGITVTPDNKIFVSDNQGNWTPGNKINQIKEGGYYGYVQNVVENGWSPDGRKIEKSMIVNDVISPEIIPVPDTFEQPSLWMPQEFDNSPGGGVWSSKAWGPLGDRFIHTSYGTGWIYHFMPHETDGVPQGAMVALPFQFDAGIQRAAVNPADNQLYVTGLTGWDDGVSNKYGVLSRVRYKGGQGHLVDDVRVVKGGVQITFNFKLDKNSTEQPANYEVSQWNYKRTHKYGSAHYSLARPGEEGEDKVSIGKVSVSEEGNTIFIPVPDMKPVNTMRIRFTVKAVDGTTVKDVTYLTINKVPNK